MRTLIHLIITLYTPPSPLQLFNWSTYFHPVLCNVLTWPKLFCSIIWTCKWLELLFFQLWTFKNLIQGELGGEQSHTILNEWVLHPKLEKNSDSECLKNRKRYKSDLDIIICRDIMFNLGTFEEIKFSVFQFFWYF